MNIVFVLYNADSTGSVMSTTQKQAEHLTAQGIRVTVVSNARPDWEISDFVHAPVPTGTIKSMCEYLSNGIFRRLPNSYSRLNPGPYLAQSAFAESLMQTIIGTEAVTNFDGIVCCQHFCTPSLTQIRDKYGVPYMLIAHGDIFSHPRSSFPVLLHGLYRHSASHAYIHADHLIGVSNSLIKRALKTGRKPGRHTVIPNGISLAEFSNGTECEIRPEKTPRLLFVGRLSPEKAVGNLLQAVAGIADPAVHLTIAGSGPDKIALELQAERLKISGRVDFLGHVPKSELPELYRSCDFVVLPSLTEAQPVVTLEAAAVGKPIVASDVGGVSDVVTDGITGLLVPPNDIPKLTAAISLLLEDAALRSRMGTAAAATACDFGWPHVLARFEEVTRHTFINAKSHKAAR